MYYHSAEQRKISICTNGETEIQQTLQVINLLSTFAIFTVLMCVKLKLSITLLPTVLHLFSGKSYIKLPANTSSHFVTKQPIYGLFQD